MKTKKELLMYFVAFLSFMIFCPKIVDAQPKCEDLATDPQYGLKGNPSVVSVSAVPEATENGTSYCRIEVNWSTPGMSGPAAGYAEGESQSINIEIGLPVATHWTGRLIMTSGGGAQGRLPSVGEEFIDNIIDTGAVAGGTDSGHEGNEDFGVIQETHKLNYGKIADWAGGRSNGIAVKLAKQVAQAYYGKSVSYTYWNGCSGGGHMGWAQVQNYPDEYDGALIGAPAQYWQQFRLADSWRAIVAKKVAQQTDPITVGQFRVANEAATAACDGADGVVDGIVADPRACTWSATNNICGKPGAPAAPFCLNTIQAAGIDRIWDGPRNSKGERVWYPYDRGITPSPFPWGGAAQKDNDPLGTETEASTNQVMQWNHADLTFDGNNLYVDQESIDLAAKASVDVTNAITYEDEATLGSHTTNDFTDASDYKLDKAFDGGMKIIVYHGTQDGAIQFRNSVDFYRRVATYFGKGNADFKGLQNWYRLFLAPGQGHCRGIFTEALAQGPLTALTDWVEEGIAPDFLIQEKGVPKGCPYPQIAIYDGVGDPNDPGSYTCGGNLDANPDAICQMLHTVYKHEN